MSSNKFLIYPQLLLLLFFLLSAKYTYADHLKGGWIKYTYKGESGGKINYEVSVYQYSDCGQPEKVDGSVHLAIYDAGSMSEIDVAFISQSNLTREQKSDFGPCFQNPPIICYLVAEYTTTISVPVNADGYILSVQRCCRIAGIANVFSSNSYGLTYTITIPGGSSNSDNSPVFAFNDAAAICF